MTHTQVSPTHHEVREHIIAGGKVEQFWHSDQTWHELRHTGQTARAWDRFMGSYPGDTTVQHGLRLVFPIPERTERIPLHRVIGRRLAAHPDIVVEGFTAPFYSEYVTVEGYPRRRPDGKPFSRQWPDNAYAFRTKLALSLGHDGTVEVLKGEREHYPFPPTHPSQQHVLDALADDWNRAVYGDGQPDEQAEVLRQARRVSEAMRKGLSPRIIAGRVEALKRASARLR